MPYQPRRSKRNCYWGRVEIPLKAAALSADQPENALPGLATGNHTGSAGATAKWKNAFQNGALLVVLNKDMIYQDENEEACSEMLKRLECYEGDAGY